MYPEAISDSVWDLLHRLNSIAQMKSCYLGGGTVLALQFGWEEVKKCMTDEVRQMAGKIQ